MISANLEAPLRWLTDSTFSLFERYGFKYSSWTPNACGKDYGSWWYAEIDDESIPDWLLYMLPYMTIRL